MMVDQIRANRRAASRVTSARGFAACFALGVALVCLTLSAADAQLRLHGESAHSSLWRRLYVQLPATWKAHRIVVVREITDEDMDRLVEQFDGPNDQEDSIVDGCYQGNAASEEIAGRITLRESLHGENAALVFVHEYGHYVWSNILTGADRTRYRRLWREQKRGHSLVTEYAGDSDEEGFAESFAYFIRRPATLRRLDTRSSRFLAEVQDRASADSADADTEP